MSYRKFAADQLFNGQKMLEQDAVLICDEAGKILEVVPRSEAGGDVQKFKGILSPGFINCHCHLELSHMKGVVRPHTGMIPFLLTVMNERNIAERQIVEAIAMQESYMQEQGIVAVGDICNTTHSLPVKAASSMRYHNFIEATGFSESNAELRFRQAHDIYLRFVEQANPCSIVPHAPYSVSERLMKLIDSFNPSSLLTLHNQESEAESEFFAYATGGFLELYRALRVDISRFSAPGTSSLVHCLQHFSPSHRLLLVHNVHTSEEDLRWLSSQGEQLPSLYFCLCPNANLYISNQLPDVPLLQKSGYPIVMGTDSIASNLQLSIYKEIETLQHRFSIDTAILLNWATFNGAEALGLGDVYGSFERGKTPGVVLLEGTYDGTLSNLVPRRIL